MSLAKETLATRRDMNTTYAELSATLSSTRDAVSARLDRAVRRTVLTLGALMVATGAAGVFLTRLYS
jgi:hypothetical protein